MRERVKGFSINRYYPRVRHSFKVCLLNSQYTHSGFSTTLWLVPRKFVPLPDVLTRFWPDPNSSHSCERLRQEVVWWWSVIVLVYPRTRIIQCDTVTLNINHDCIARRQPSVWAPANRIQCLLQGGVQPLAFGAGCPWPVNHRWFWEIYIKPPPLLFRCNSLFQTSHRVLPHPLPHIRAQHQLKGPYFAHPPKRFKSPTVRRGFLRFFSQRPPT